VHARCGCDGETDGRRRRASECRRANDARTTHAPGAGGWWAFAAAGAALGCAHSKGALGRCYLNGYGVAEDEKRGLALGRESAAAGSCFGQYVVAVCYYFACGGVSQDYAEAARLFRLAAEQGHSAAQCNMGFMFHRGEGVAQDRAEAIRWCRLAAKQGDANAKKALPP
jgi:TPR repeat protein